MLVADFYSTILSQIENSYFLSNCLQSHQLLMIIHVVAIDNSKRQNWRYTAFHSAITHYTAVQ